MTSIYDIEHETYSDVQATAIYDAIAHASHGKEMGLLLESIGDCEYTLKEMYIAVSEGQSKEAQLKALHNFVNDLENIINENVGENA